MENRTNARLFLIAAALSSAACTPADDYDEKVGVENAADGDGGDDAGSADAAPARSGPGEVAVENAMIEFRHSWPAEANAIAPLAQALEQRAQTVRAEAEAVAAQDRDAAEGAEYEFRPHASEKEWQTVADLPDWLSLSATLYSFTGGAHPNSGFDTLLWDKRAQTIRQPLDLFRSVSAFRNAVWGRFCAQLNAERAERRGQPVNPASTDEFDACPRPDEVTVILGSSDKVRFDRIGILVGPYVAGPYAEGSYDFTIPVDSAVIDAVKPAYVAAFGRGPRDQKSRNSGR